MAVVAKPQGLRGEVVLRLFNPHSSFWQPGKRFWVEGTDGVGRWRTIEAFGRRRLGGVAKFESVSSREEAELLVGHRLFVDRAELPEPGEQEAYLSDLVGMAVLDLVGRRVGTVVALQEARGRDFLVVEEGGRQQLWPAEPALLSSIDMATRTLRLSVDVTETE